MTTNVALEAALKQNEARLAASGIPPEIAAKTCPNCDQHLYGSNPLCGDFDALLDETIGERP